MDGVAMPLADEFYFPGGGNSVAFMTPAGIEGIAGRLTYSSLNGMFSMIWDQARTTEVPEKLGQAMCELTTPTWPHTFVVPKYASMVEYKQYPPANHFHMTWDLPVARLQHWMDLTGVLSVTPWAARPKFIEGVDRPQPLIHLISGGENTFKSLRVRC
jgi:L-fucose isomerase